MARVNHTNYMTTLSTTFLPTEYTTAATSSYANKLSVFLCVLLIGLLLAIAAILLIWKFRRPYFVQKLDEEALQCREKQGVNAAEIKSDIQEEKTTLGSSGRTGAISFTAPPMPSDDAEMERKLSKASQQRRKSTNSQDLGAPKTRLTHLASERCEVQLSTTRPFLATKTAESPTVIPCKTEERKGRPRRRNSTGTTSPSREHSNPLTRMRPVHSEEVTRAMSHMDLQKKASH